MTMRSSPSSARLRLEGGEPQTLMLSPTGAFEFDRAEATQRYALVFDDPRDPLEIQGTADTILAGRALLGRDGRPVTTATNVFVPPNPSYSAEVIGSTGQWSFTIPPSLALDWHNAVATGNGSVPCRGSSFTSRMTSSAPPVVGPRVSTSARTRGKLPTP